MKEHLTVIVIGRTNLKRFVNKCINLVSTLNLAFVVISVLYVINVQPCAGPCCYFHSYYSSLLKSNHPRLCALSIFQGTQTNRCVLQHLSNCLRRFKCQKVLQFSIPMTVQDVQNRQEAVLKGIRTRVFLTLSSTYGSYNTGNYTQSSFSVQI